MADHAGAVAIRTDGIWKRFVIGPGRGVFGSRKTLGGQIGDRWAALRGRGSGAPSARETEFWALRDVSFEVTHGEVVGVIGRNGAGKSTLLKILSRITEPTRGVAELYGRVGSLLEVGVGFHPELTGRENIYLSGAIQGMRRAEINRRFDEIVAFAETEKFVDTPVKRYSSGMYLRLAFAVAAHLEQEILLVDEVLAVGDAQFQRKCIGKMQDVAGQGKTVLFVSHNMAAVSGLCQRTLLLSNGELSAMGPTGEIIERYLAEGALRAQVSLEDRQDREGNGRLRFRSMETRVGGAMGTGQVATGQRVQFAVSYALPSGAHLQNVDVALHIRGSLGELMMVCQASISDAPFERLEQRGEFVCTIPRFPLPPGIYAVSLWASTGMLKEDILDKVENAMPLEVVEGDFYGTGRLPANKNRSVLVEYNWGVQRAESGK